MPLMMLMASATAVAVGFCLLIPAGPSFGKASFPPAAILPTPPRIPRRK
ncbi:MAG TPA: hypothetical protein VG753_02665 [Candidatus Paceibacterota bacterium]|nr:hypothetical protein [Candidatus Paceibacterota bacterium]